MEHKHEWEVYSTALVDAAIMVRCGCGALGCVPSGKFRQADWNEAFHAPSAPYPLRRGLVAKVAVGKERLMRNGAGRKVGECHCRCHMASGIAVSMRLVACDGEASSQGLFCLACGRPKGAEGQGEDPRRNPDPPFGGPLGRGC